MKYTYLTDIERNLLSSEWKKNYEIWFPHIQLQVLVCIYVYTHVWKICRNHSSVKNDRDSLLGDFYFFCASFYTVSSFYIRHKHFYRNHTNILRSTAHWDFPVAQWLRLLASTAGVVVGSLDGGLRFHMPCSVAPPKREQWLRAQVWGEGWVFNPSFTIWCWT